MISIVRKCVVTFVFCCLSSLVIFIVILALVMEFTILNAIGEPLVGPCLMLLKLSLDCPICWTCYCLCLFSVCCALVGCFFRCLNTCVSDWLKFHLRERRKTFCSELIFLYIFVVTCVECFCCCWSVKLLWRMFVFDVEATVVYTVDDGSSNSMLLGAISLVTVSPILSLHCASTVRPTRPICALVTLLFCCSGLVWRSVYGVGLLSWWL